MRTANPIESTFATVRLRQRVTADQDHALPDCLGIRADRRRASPSAYPYAAHLGAQPGPEPFSTKGVLKPGRRVQLAFAVLADGFADRLARLPETVGDLAQVRDAGSGWRDPLPTLYSTMAICHSVGQSFREHIGKVVATAGDMAWDGEHIDEMSQDDAMPLTRLQRGES